MVLLLLPQLEQKMADERHSSLSIVAATVASPIEAGKPEVAAVQVEAVAARIRMQSPIWASAVAVAAAGRMDCPTSAYRGYFA